MSNGKKVRVKVKTATSTYEGYLLVPPMRNRVSDILNEEERIFINLTDVRINGSQEATPYISINRNLIESIVE